MNNSNIVIKIEIPTAANGVGKELQADNQKLIELYDQSNQDRIKLLAKVEQLEKDNERLFMQLQAAIARIDTADNIRPINSIIPQATKSI